MKIEYYGHSFVKLTFNDFSVAIDPYGDIGLIPPEVFADYVFCTHNHYDHNNAAIVNGAACVRADGKRFETVRTFHDEKRGALRGNNDVLIIFADGKKVVHLGDIGVFDENVVEKTRGADLMFLPVGGNYTIDAAVAYEYIKAAKPKVAVPIHYKIEGCTVDIAKIDGFLKLFENYKTVKSGFVFDNDESGLIVVTPEVKNV